MGTPVKNKTILYSARHLLADYKNVYIYLGISIAISMVLQWSFQYEVLWEIITNEGLNAGEKTQEIFQAYLNLFRLIDDITPVSILLISFIQGLAATMLLNIKNSKDKAKQVGSSAAALLGMGCVSCGGSLLTPLLTAIASDITVSQAQRVGNIVLLISLVLSYVLLTRVSKEYAFYKEANRKNR